MNNESNNSNQLAKPKGKFGPQLRNSLSSKMKDLHFQTEMKRKRMMPFESRKSKTVPYLQNITEKDENKKWKSTGNSIILREQARVVGMAKGIVFSKIESKIIEDDDPDFYYEEEDKNLDRVSQKSSSIESFDFSEPSDLSNYDFSIEKELKEKNNIEHSQANFSLDDSLLGGFKILKENQTIENIKKGFKISTKNIKPSEKSEKFILKNSSNFHILFSKDEYNDLKNSSVYSLSQKNDSENEEEFDKISLDSKTYKRISNLADSNGKISYENLFKAFFPSGSIPNFTALCNFRLLENQLFGRD